MDKVNEALVKFKETVLSDLRGFLDNAVEEHNGDDQFHGLLPISTFEELKAFDQTMMTSEPQEKEEFVSN